MQASTETESNGVCGSDEVFSLFNKVEVRTHNSQFAIGVLRIVTM
jgi:hypothetical protein